MPLLLCYYSIAEQWQNVQKKMNTDKIIRRSQPPAYSLKNDRLYGLASSISFLQEPASHTPKINILLIFHGLGVIEKEPHPIEFFSVAFSLMAMYQFMKFFPVDEINKLTEEAPMLYHKSSSLILGCCFCFVDLTIPTRRIFFQDPMIIGLLQ